MPLREAVKNIPGGPKPINGPFRDLSAVQRDIGGIKVAVARGEQRAHNNLQALDSSHRVRDPIPDLAGKRASEDCPASRNPQGLAR